MSISRIVKHLSTDRSPAAQGDNKFKRIVAVVGTITNDARLLNVPEGLRVVALKFTQAAKNRITGAKGTCYTFDQLAQLAPNGKNVLLLRGPRDR